MRADLKDAHVSILLEIDGKLHLCGFKPDDLEAVTALIKIAVKTAYRTERTQNELREFIGMKNAAVGESNGQTR